MHMATIDVYTWPTPNGHKVHIMLEECGLPYTAIPVNIGAGEQFRPEFLAISPNNKIPVLLDPDGPDGKPISLFESGAILMYLAEKTGQFWPTDMRARHIMIQWLMFQMGGVGPMFGQLGFFHKFAGKDIEDKRPRDRYVAESRRLLGVLDARLKGRRWIMGDDYTIADMAILPWVRNLVQFYGAGELVGYADFVEVQRVLDAFLARPAVQAGLNQPPRN
jgi:GST-like protein